MTSPQRYGQGRQRTLTPAEQALWQSVTADTLARPGMREKLDGNLSLATGRETSPPKQTSQHKGHPLSLSPSPAGRAPVPPLSPLDRRTSKKLVRGQLTPEARLDLHGMTRQSAEPALLRFVTSAHAQGLKLVLVITGKGVPGHLLHGREFHHDPAGRSVLRNFVPDLLQESQFRTHVTGFQPAHPKHGGGGALYLWLRRRK